MWRLSEALFYQVAVALALPLIAAYVALAWYHFWAGRRLFNGPGRIAATLGLVTAPLAALRLAWLVWRSESSTAPLALLYAPLYSAILGGVVFLLAWSLATAGRASRRLLRREEALTRLSAVRLAVALVVLSVGAAGALREGQRQALVGRASDPRHRAEELRALYQQLISSPDPLVLAALASHPALPPPVLADLARQAAPGLRRPARSPLWLLGKDLEPDSVLERVAVHPNTPAESLELLAADESPEVAAAVARNPKVPGQALTKLAQRPEAAVALAVVANPGTAAEVLELLASHPEPGVRERVARSPRTAASLLEALSRDPSWVVRGSVALNPRTPPQALAGLVDDRDERVRFYLATNPRTPRRALEALAQDQDEKVRRYAAQNLATRDDGE
jgi:hypothetical protein